MSPKTALIVGSTGLIGSQLLDLLLEDVNYSSIVAVTRRRLEVSNPKLVNVICELNQLADHSQELKADDVFCCLGTTIKKAKSKEAFRTVDFEAPLALAKITKKQGAKRFLLISALGANKNSSIFYNRVKGEVEEAVQQEGYTECHIFRPSLLLGPRKEHRSGEEAGKVFDKVFGWLIPLKYRPIESIKVARAMQAFALQDLKGYFIHESIELQSF
jgi:uncharacterized protein YbjT (DUF2867 family)